MRIGMFCDMYLPHVSGVTNHIRLYGQALSDLGHEVSIFTYGNRSEHDQGLTVHRSPAMPWGSTGWNLPLGLSDDAREAMERLDIAHAHHPFASCLTPLKHCAPRGVPVVFTNHTRYDLYSDVYASFMPASFRHEGIRRYLTHLNDRVSLTISPSRELAAWLEGYGVQRDKLLVFPNGIDIRPFAHPSTRRSRADLGLSDDDFVYCYVGRIAHEKNVQLLLEAFSRAASEDRRLSLVMVGDGPARRECEEAAEKYGLTSRVRFLGATPYEQVPAVLSACDAFVTASVSEVYPLVIVEACAAGLPVVGVRSPGVGEIVSHEESGLLVSENVGELSGAIGRLAADQELFSRVRAGAAAVAEAHEIGASAGRLAAVYEGLLTRAPVAAA